MTKSVQIPKYRAGAIPDLAAAAVAPSWTVKKAELAMRGGIMGGRCKGTRRKETYSAAAVRHVLLVLIMLEQRPISAEQVGDFCGVSRQTAERCINALVDSGLVTRKRMNTGWGSGRPTKYSVSFERLEELAADAERIPVRPSRRSVGK